MAVEEAIVGLLRADAGVTAIVGSGAAARIDPHPAPAGIASPFVTYQVVGLAGIETTFDDGLPSIDAVQLQIDCWAESETSPASYTQVRDLASAVKVALRDKATVAEGVSIINILFDDWRDLPEQQFRRRQLDFSIWTRGV